MSSFGLSIALAFLLVVMTTALPNELMSALKDMPDLTQPENTMMGQSLKEIGVEICPDKLHLCPATAYCCQKEDGKWDCCPKTAANAPNNIFLGAGECCHQLGFIWHCCTPLHPNASGGDAGLSSDVHPTWICS
ncbi:uncharacterized protein CEXT_446501 [Caerostris extrusa]|uniref:Uncharacterized protein n=1 Tax=Caerostris extrusa TaxID=172846 RepID=A0AAV4V0N8_CAEEX|nr:uncharacterized protein CEXT_446501 [Caerostris extrusa]